MCGCCWVQCVRRKTTAWFPDIARLKLARPRFMDRATPSCSEDMSPMPARHPQGSNKVVPPQRFSYVFQTCCVRFFVISLALSGDTDKPFANVFDVGGSSNKNMKKLWTHVFLKLSTYIYECFRLMISTIRLRKCSRYSGRKVWLDTIEHWYKSNMLCNRQYTLHNIYIHESNIAIAITYW